MLCSAVCSVVSDSAMSWTVAARLLCPWNFPGKNTAVGCHFLLQGTFLSEELNPHLLVWQADSLPLRHLGSSNHHMLLDQGKKNAIVEGNVWVKQV